MSYPYAALVTLLTVILMLGCGIYVGRARTLYGIKAPATTGHELFERAFRIQMNTIEGVLLFLPVLWLCAVYKSDMYAGVLGVAWVAARVFYAVTYARDPSSRSAGFGISLAATVMLFILSLLGLIPTMLR